MLHVEGPPDKCMQLLDYITEVAIQKRCKHMVLEADAKNRKLLAWYESQGFQTTKTLKDYYATQHDAVKMRRIIKKESESSNLIVVDNPGKWSLDTDAVTINDNPNIDAGIEDLILGDELYQKIMNSFMNKIEKERGPVRFEIDKQLSIKQI